MNSECQCCGAGFCQRHLVQKSKREQELCSGTNCSPEVHNQYWRAWEEGRMKGISALSPLQQSGRSKTKSVGVSTSIKAGDKIKSRGLGDTIANAIQFLSAGLVRPCSGCKQRAAMLNQLMPHEAPPVELVECSSIRRNLLYHIYPVRSATAIWQWNIEELLKRIELFNGNRIVAIALDSETVAPEEVEKAFDGHVTKFIHSTNEKSLREVITFIPLLENNESTDPNDVTFFAHAKGSGRGYGPETCVRAWTKCMYEVCLDHWELVQESLKSHAMAGAFRRFGQFQTRGSHQWHYSGTFYWFRNRDVYRRNWRYLPNRFWGVEAWPGLMFKPEETACLFHDQCGDLYQWEYWTSKVEPELTRWKQNLSHIS